MNLHEELFAKEFLVEPARSRFLTLIQQRNNGKEKGASKLSYLLAHHLSGGLHPERCRLFSPPEIQRAAVARLLQEYGAPETCYRISAWKSESTEVTTAEMLDHLNERVGCIYSFLPGQLALYESEGTNATWLCTK